MKRVAHFPDLDIIRKSRLKKSTLFEMDRDAGAEGRHRRIYAACCTELWAGTIEPLARQVAQGP